MTDIAAIRAALKKATQQEWEWAFYSKPDGSDIKTVEDVAETLAFQARQGTGTILWGVGIKGHDLIVASTGNGPTSEANAALISAAPAWLRELCDEVEELRGGHCKDCCCAQSWKVLGITEYDGLSIPSHIATLRRDLAEAKRRIVELEAKL